MSARVFLFIFMLFNLAYTGWYTALEIRQRKKPLPPEIADIYDAERYQSFLSYETDINKLYYADKAVMFLIDACLLFSPIYAAIDSFCNGNVYLIFICTDLIYNVVGIVDSLIYSYIYTFKIEEKYGLNKKTIKVFIRDFALNQALSLFTTFGLMMLMIFIGENMVVWTRGYTVSWLASLLICGIVFLLIFGFSLIASVMSLVVMKKKYTFTPLPAGDLREKIEALMVGSKKKVKEIYVYDESKKSVDKNAFLLKLLWHREFGIADNFLNENSERELLAVLSHEVGHLKHKKNWRNYLKYGITAAVFVFVAANIHNPAAFQYINRWVRASFGLSANSYYIMLFVYEHIAKPVLFMSSLYSHYVSRCEEDEADGEAVKNGYGADLINTFKRLSSDELVDIYPHPIIEFIEHGHPGMYNRIKAIQAKMGNK